MGNRSTSHKLLVTALLSSACFMWAAIPAAATPSCTPTANGDTGSLSRTAAAGTQICTGGDTGIDYTATDGNLTVDLNNDAISGHAININDDGGARNITVNVGLPSSGYTAAAVFADDSSNNAIKLVSSGGDIALTTYAGGAVTYSGASNASYAINAQTSGIGAIAITTNDAVTDTLGTGIAAQAVNGNITIAANADITAANEAITAQATGTGNTSVALGGGVTIATPAFGLVSRSSGGTAGVSLGADDAITAAAPTESYGIFAESDMAPGSPSITTSVSTGAGDAITVTGQNSAAVYASNEGSGTGGISVVVGDGNAYTVNGDASFGVLAQTTDVAGKSITGSGNISLQFGNDDTIAVNAGNGLGAVLPVSAGVAAISDGGNVGITWTGTGGSVGVQAAGGIGTVGILAETDGTGIASVATGVGTTVQTGNGDGIDVFAANGAANLTALGNVTATGGDALHAATSGMGDVTIVAGSASDAVTITATDSTHNAVYGVSNGGNVDVTTYGTIAGNMNLATTGAGNILVTANGAITATGDYSSIYANTANGNITVTTNGAVTDGMSLVSAGTGNITVTTNGTVTEPGPYASIYASSNGGNVAVTTNGAISTGLNANTTGTGTITVATNGNITNTQAFDSIYAEGQNGAVSVMVNSGTVNGTQGNDDVDALATGIGNVAVTLGNAVTLDPATTGVFAASAGGISNITTGIGDIVTAADTDTSGGLSAKSELAPASSTLTASIMTGADNTVTVTGDDSAGLIAVNEGNGLGGVDITTGAGNQITVTGNTVGAIVASTVNGIGTGSGAAFDGSGDVSVSVGANNTLLVNAGTDTGGLSPASAGIVAVTAGGNVNVNWTGGGGSITVNGAPGIATFGIAAISDPAVAGPETMTIVTGSGTTIASNNGFGIGAINLNDGLTTVTSNGAITGSAVTGNAYVAAIFGSAFPGYGFGSGIYVAGGGSVAVTSNAAISFTGADGIDELAGTAATLTNNAAITSNQSAIVALAGTNLSIVNAGTVAGAGSANHPVIGFDGASVTIANSAAGIIHSNAGLPTDTAIEAVMTGTGPVTIINDGLIVGEVNLSDASASTFNNAGTWTTSGTSSFSSGAFANSGTVIASGTTTFSGLGTFTNTGLLDMHSRNAAAGDTTTIPGTFVGGTGSQLAVDSYLGTTASGSTCGALSDCLKIGGSSGVTSIIVHDTAPVSAAGYNPGGVLVVSGASSASNFVLDPSSSGYNATTKTLDEGLFNYALGYNDGQVRLFGAPDAIAHQLPELVTGAENLWYETSPWLNRQADLRDQLGPNGEGNVTPGFWTKAVGNFVQRDGATAATVGGSSLVYDTSYNQNSYGVIAGGDFGTRGLWAPGDALIAGLMGGYVSSDLDFSSTAVSAHLSGAFVGAYLTYIDSGWVIDGAFKANLLTLRYDSGGTSLFDTNPSVRSYGGEIDTGRRLFVDRDAFIEPLASIAYVTTSVGDTTVMGTPTSFGQGGSGRASLGARAGTLEFSTPQNIIDASLTGRIWDAFGASSQASLVSSSATLPVSDNFSGVFGEVGGNLQILDRQDGWSTFFATSVKFKDHFTSETLTAGVRYHW